MKNGINENKAPKRKLDLKDPDVYNKCVVEFSEFHSDIMLMLDKIMSKYEVKKDDFDEEIEEEFVDDYDEESENETSGEWMILDILYRFYQEYVKDLGNYDLFEQMVDASIEKIKSQNLDKKLATSLKKFKKDYMGLKDEIIKKYNLSEKGLVLEIVE